MKFGSVCSGIEAASVAWEPLGWKAAWFSEIEPFPSAVLAHHYPDVPNLGDMTKLPWRIASGEVEAPDVFCGGTPCQAFSVAGLRRSLDDARGNLSLIFCEIANEIDKRRLDAGLVPSIIFWENVPGVLSTKDNAFGCFLAGLAGEDGELEPPGGKWPNAGAVYGPARAVAWRVLDAQYFGVAQRRRRVFVVASAREGFDPAAVLFEFDGVRRDTAPSREAGQATTRGFTAGPSGVGFTDIAPTLDCRAKNGPMQNQIGMGVLEPWVNGVCPTLRAGGNTTGGHRPPGTDVDTCDSLIVQPHAKWPADIACTLNAAFGSKLGLEDQHINGGNAVEPMHNIAPCLTGADRHGVATVFDPNQITSPDNRSNPQPGAACHTLPAKENAPLMAYTTKLHNTKSNNAGKLFKERTPCLDANSPAPALLTASQVRRLTPVECERLQGFPDGYTAIPWRKKPTSECPDGPRYKALGNSWAVPNVRWIGRRIQDELEVCE